jgi:hypothetical protein
VQDSSYGGKIMPQVGQELGNYSKNLIFLTKLGT